MRRRGAAAVEFALVLPVLLALIFGLIDWGWFLFYRVTYTMAAQRGVRLAAGAPMSRDPVALAEQEARAWLLAYGADPTGADIHAELVGSGADEEIQVTVSRTYEPLIGLVPTPDLLFGQASGGWYGGP